MTMCCSVQGFILEHAVHVVNNVT